jgi:hypothetical protein
MLLALENVLVCFYSVKPSLSVDCSNLTSGSLGCVRVNTVSRWCHIKIAVAEK